jgi:hypothetical protein
VLEVGATVRIALEPGPVTVLTLPDDEGYFRGRDDQGTEADFAAWAITTVAGLPYSWSPA